MAYSPSNKVMIDLIEWALDHGYNPYTSITSLPERRDRLYRAYTEITKSDSEMLKTLELLISSAWLSVDHSHNRTPEALAHRERIISSITRARGE